MTKASINAEKAEQMAAASTASTTLGEWKVFVDLGIVPTQIVCSEYKPVELATVGCHSRTLLTADAIERHILADHGGCFLVDVEFSDAQAGWPGWAELATRGYRLVDFRCDCCQEELVPSTQTITRHLNIHQNSNGRRMENKTFRMKIAQKGE